MSSGTQRDAVAGHRRCLEHRLSARAGFLLFPAGAALAPFINRDVPHGVGGALLNGRAFRRLRSIVRFQDGSRPCGSVLLYGGSGW